MINQQEEIKQIKKAIVSENKIKRVNIQNPIEEYFKNNADKESTFQDLFEATPENVDLRTDLTINEIIILNKIRQNCLFLGKKLDSDIYGDFFNSYLRLKVSKDRLSRAEFVDINRKERFEKDLQKFGNFKALSDIKK
jgi:predicted acetyltransferase